MKVTLLISITIIVILSLIFGFYGGFTKVEFRIESLDEEVLAYKDMLGDYAQSGAVSDEVYKILLEDYQVETYRGFGLYYDNPKKVEKSQLRSEIGCIVEDEDVHKLDKIKGDLKTKVSPKGSYLVTEFPFKGKISVLLGIAKIYPAMEKYIQANNLNCQSPMMEIYDVPNKKIIYRKRI